MTQKEFDERNALGFEGDSFLEKEIISLCNEFEIDEIIETGTYKGFTTRKLAQIRPTKTVEIDEKFYQEAKENIGSLAEMHFGDTVDFLNKVLPSLDGKKLFFYLDAHFYTRGCPLLDELKTIGRLAPDSVIMIHDFVNPNNPDYGFDVYNKQPLNLDYIVKTLPRLYTNGFRFHYNKDAEGAKRGVIFIYPQHPSS